MPMQMESKKMPAKDCTGVSSGFHLLAVEWLRVCTSSVRSVAMDVQPP